MPCGIKAGDEKQDEKSADHPPIFGADLRTRSPVAATKHTTAPKQSINWIEIANTTPRMVSLPQRS